MKITLIKSIPYLLILIGIILLLYMSLPIQAGGCLLLGIVMVIEKIYPEKWGDDN